MWNITAYTFDEAHALLLENSLSEMFTILSWYLPPKHKHSALLEADKFSGDASCWLIDSQTDSNSNFTRNDNSFQNQLVSSLSFFFSSQVVFKDIWKAAP